MADQEEVNKVEEEGEEEEENPLKPKFLSEICRKHGGYSTPHLNDKIYLHCQSILKIENLEEYTGLKCIYLQSNAISKIEGLGHQTKLRTLFIHQNIIRKLENLSHMKDLRQLNISENFVEKIENLEGLEFLENIDISGNHLTKTDDLIHLLKLPSLIILDISKNRIDDPDVFEKVIFKLKKIRLLRMSGNPVIRKYPKYRKKLICALPDLKNLDDYPVFDDERRCTLAWEKGGIKAEQEERKKLREEKASKMRKNFDFFKKLSEEGEEELKKKSGISKIVEEGEGEGEEEVNTSKKTNSVIKIQEVEEDEIIDLTGKIGNSIPKKKIKKFEENGRDNELTFITKILNDE